MLYNKSYNRVVPDSLSICMYWSNRHLLHDSEESGTYFHMGPPEMMAPILA